MSKEAFKRIIELAMMYQDEGPGESFRRTEEMTYWQFVTDIQERLNRNRQSNPKDFMGAIVCCDEIDLRVCPESPYRSEIERKADETAIQECLSSDEVKSLDEVSARIVRAHAQLRRHADDYEDFIQYVRHFLPEHLASIPRLNFFGEPFGESVYEVGTIARAIEASARVKAEQLGHRIALCEDGTESDTIDPELQSVQYLVWLAMQWQVREYWEYLFHTRIHCDGLYLEIPSELHSAYWNARGKIDEISWHTEPSLEARQQSCVKFDEHILSSDKRIRSVLEFYSELRIGTVKFKDLEKYVRKHIPEMLENVPVVDDFAKDWDLDLFKVCNGMRAIEVAARKRAAELGITVHAESPELPVMPVDTARREQLGRASNETPKSPQADAERAEPATSHLPFGLLKDDDFKKIRRVGYHTPIELNESEWELFLLLCRFHPGRVAKASIDRLFNDDPHGRNNTPKRLREKLTSIGLTVSDFSLLTV